MRKRKLFQLAVLLCVFGAFCLVLFQSRRVHHPETVTNVIVRKEVHLPDWLVHIQPNQHNSRLIQRCRFTLQSPSAVVDDRGVLCNRTVLSVHGCCPRPGALSSTRSDELSLNFVCSTCNKDHCCQIYEHCVSCCVNPENLPLWREVFRQALQFNQRHLLISTNPFELCQAKCRTSSLSVRHENSYRDAARRYCFAWELNSQAQDPNDT